MENENNTEVEHIEETPEIASEVTGSESKIETGETTGSEAIVE